LIVPTEATSTKAIAVNRRPAICCTIEAATVKETNRETETEKQKQNKISDQCRS